VANGLVENQFHRHARIGAGEHGSKRLLFICRFLFQDGQVVLNRRQLICSETLIAREQFLQSRIRT